MGTLLPPILPEDEKTIRRLVTIIESSPFKLNLLIALCQDRSYRTYLIEALKDRLAQKGIQHRSLQLPLDYPSLRQALSHLIRTEPDFGQTPACVNILGIDELLDIHLKNDRTDIDKFLFSLQWTREALRNFSFPIILWVNQDIVNRMSFEAPDFWSWRGNTVFEFEGSDLTNYPTTTISSQQQLHHTVLDFSNSPTALLPIEDLQAQITTLQAQDPHSPLLASAYASLGHTYLKRIEQGQAIDRKAEEAAGMNALNIAIALQEDYSLWLGLARSLNDLALFYYSQGRYGEAEGLYQRSLFIIDQQLGGDHPDAASILNNLAYLYQSQSRYTEAELLYKRSLLITEQALGKEHLDTVSLLNNLAYLYQSRRQYSEAEVHYTQALNILIKALGEKHPTTERVMSNFRDCQQQRSLLTQTREERGSAQSF